MADPQSTVIRPHLTEARTKIIATVGPACDSEAILAELVNHGVDIFRINAAHGKQADFAVTLEKIKKVREMTGFPVGVLLDLAGPKIRLGALSDGPIDVKSGDELFFIRGNIATEKNQLVSK